MFYYTFSVINTMFVPCTALLYDSTAATQTLKLSATPLSISSGIHLISLLMMSCLVCGLFSQTVFQVRPSENSQAGWDLENRMARGYRFDAKWVCLMGSYAWGIQVICSSLEYLMFVEAIAIYRRRLFHYIFQKWSISCFLAESYLCIFS